MGENKGEEIEKGYLTVARVRTNTSDKRLLCRTVSCVVTQNIEKKRIFVCMNDLRCIGQCHMADTTRGLEISQRQERDLCKRMNKESR